MKWIIENFCEMDFIITPKNFISSNKYNIVVTSLFKNG